MNRAYYKYNFVSADSLFAKIQEEMKSYFATGAIDTILFPTWTDWCIRHLGKAGYPILSYVLEMCDYVATLPENFISAREVWACERLNDIKYKEGSSTYTQLSTLITPDADNSCVTSDCNFPDQMMVVYKTNSEQRIPFSRTCLLHPGNLSVKQYCSDDCFNFIHNHNGWRHDRDDTFDIHGNKLVTSFREGHIYLVYYSSSDDVNGDQLIPDDFRIQNYIEAYIKYKLFEQLCNQTTDESYKIVEGKKQEYKQASDEAYILMDINSKKHTVEQSFDSMNRTRRRNTKYIIR